MTPSRDDLASANPVLVEVTRGGLIESYHRGAIAIADDDGEIKLALGDIDTPIYPRSAVKFLQAIPLIESGAADAYGLNTTELAVACGSHSGEAVHIAAVRSLLAKAGIEEGLLACGAHSPLSERATRELDRAGRGPLAIHNNCSGKHAGMLATAKHLGLGLKGYERPDHPVQVEIARIISEICGAELMPSLMGIDGCSVPSWALPLTALARGFGRLSSGKGLSPARATAARRLMHACFAAPILVAGEGRFDTIVMRGLAPKVFVKGGAEGVHCAVLPELGLGIALKIDDGGKRGADAALAEVLATLIPGAAKVLGDRFAGEIRNWRGLRVGSIEAGAQLEKALRELTPAAPR
jgi:L-asparaginase II